MLTACNDSAGPASGDRLTREEALLIAGEVSGSVGSTSAVPVGNAALHDGVAADPITFTHALEGTLPCPRGGSVRLNWVVSGVIDAEAGSMQVDIDGTHAPSACAYLHKGVTLTITGDPDIDFDAHFAAANGEPSDPFTAHIEGAFSWTASDGRSGDCAITYDSEMDFIARTRTIEGNICGHAVSETLTWN